MFLYLKIVCVISKNCHWKMLNIALRTMHSDFVSNVSCVYTYSFLYRIAINRVRTYMLE